MPGRRESSENMKSFPFSSGGPADAGGDDVPDTVPDAAELSASILRTIGGHQPETFNATDYLLNRNLRAERGSATAVVAPLGR